MKRGIADKVEQIAIADLIPYARNARTHSPEQVQQIARSIQEFGWTNPVLIDEKGNIIAGHGRVMAAKELGMDKVPCLRLAGLTEAQQRAYRIADNQLALNAGWDDALLADELRDLGSIDFDIGLIGVSDEDIDRLFDGIGEPEAGVDPDYAPVIEAAPITITGDAWVLGRNIVMCGDSRNKSSALALMRGEEADLLVTDPPYNVGYVGKTADAMTIDNDFMPDIEFRKFMVDCFCVAYDVMKPGAGFYIWHADSEGLNVRMAILESGLIVRQCLIWAKNSMVLGRQDYHWQHEPCLYGWKEGAAHRWYGDRKQTTLLMFDRPSRSDVHPTMKPVDLIRYQIENSSKKGDVVLDLFGGSGTTLIACEMIDRSARIMEVDPKYVDVIVRRWQEYTGETAVHAESGEPFPG